MQTDVIYNIVANFVLATAVAIVAIAENAVNLHAGAQQLFSNFVSFDLRRVLILCKWVTAASLYIWNSLISKTRGSSEKRIFSNKDLRTKINSK